MQPDENATPLLIGTAGWDFDPPDHAGAEGFYPDDLPSEWRFAFYSNRFRAVYVPGEVWQGGAGHATDSPACPAANPADWAADCEEAFRFVIELPPGLACPASPEVSAQGFERFVRQIEPLHHRIAGLCLRVAAGPAGIGNADTEWLARMIALLSDYRPVCVDLPEDWPARALTVVAQADAGLVWRPDDESSPETTGRFTIARQSSAHPRVLRHTIEALAKWRGADRVAGLFIEPAAGATKSAEEARLIAELLGT